MRKLLMNQSSSQAAFAQTDEENINIYTVHSVIHTNTKHHHNNTDDTNIININNKVLMLIRNNKIKQLFSVCSTGNYS